MASCSFSPIVFLANFSDPVQKAANQKFYCGQ